MSSNKEYDCIIIGAGAAGLTAALYAVRRTLKTVVIMNKFVRYKLTMADVIEYLGQHYISLSRTIQLDKNVSDWLERNINNLNSNI